MKRGDEIVCVCFFFFIKICDDGDILRNMSILLYRLLRHPDNPVIHAHIHVRTNLNNTKLAA